MDEEEAVFCRADCSGFEAGRARPAGADLIRQVGITEQAFNRWKRQYGGLESDQVRELKQVTEENARLKRLVAELSLDQAVLQGILSKKFPGQCS